MDVILFTYCLVATRVAWQYYILTQTLIKKRYITQLPRVVARGILAVIIWPADALIKPKAFLGAYMLSNAAATFELFFYYSKTSL